MSSTRYLEINSTYRDRNLYPSPADFVVEISQSGQKDRKQALDPVCESSPILSWNNSFLEDTAAFTTAENTDSITVDSTYSTSDAQILYVSIGGTSRFRAVNGFYNGAIFSINSGGAVVRRRIASYTYINGTNAILEMDTPFPSTVFTASGVIENPTPIDTSTASSTIYFFIPSSLSIENAYVGAYVDLVSSPGGITTLESRRIVSFNGDTHLAELSAPTTDNWVDNGTAAEANSNFAIRYALPCNEGDLLGVSTNGKVLQLASTVTSNPDQVIGSFLRMIEPVPTAGTFSTATAPCYEERRIVNFYGDDGVFSAIAVAGTTFTIITGSTQDFTGAFITNSTAGETRLISSYNTATKSGVVSSAWGGGVLAGDAYFIRTIELQSGFTTAPTTGAGNNAYELECYTRDNWNPFNYTGSLVSAQQSVCYEIELINLILPNSTLVTGGRAIFYPYLYVKFESVSSASAGHKGVIYSNNPHANAMMFRAVVDDNAQPANSPFIKIDSDGMVQTLKFKTTDNFRFGVYLPNGVLFQTVEQDYYSPTVPNPLVQISALFSLKKVD